MRIDYGFIKDKGNKVSYFLKLINKFETPAVQQQTKLKQHYICPKLKISCNTTSLLLEAVSWVLQLV